jgi:hypothetical protein
VEELAGEDEHGAARHLRGDGIFRLEGCVSVGLVASGHDAGSSHLLGAVGQRPERLAVDLIVICERVGIEQQLISVEEPRVCARRERDHLR